MSKAIPVSGKKFRIFRESLGSRKKVQELVGLSITRMQQIELSDQASIFLDNFDRLAEVANIPKDVLKDRLSPGDSIPQTFKRWREQAGITEQVLANKAGVKTSVIQELETGTSIPGRKLLRTIGGVMGKTLEEVERKIALNPLAPANDHHRATENFAASLPGNPSGRQVAERIEQIVNRNPPSLSRLQSAIAAAASAQGRSVDDIHNDLAGLLERDPKFKPPAAKKK